MKYKDKACYSRKFIESQLVENNMHMFVYGKNNQNRERLLKEIANKYPFHFCSDKISVVYIDEFGLPIFKGKNIGLDSSKKNNIAFEYLNLTIVQAILKKIFSEGVKDLDYIKRVLKVFEYYKEIKSIEELINSLQKSRDFYSACYLNGENYTLSNFEKLDISFIFDICMIVREVQKATKNNASFQIILDRKDDIPIESVKAINTLINMRSNGEFSVKVVCEADEWETNRDIVNNFPEYIHDYDILDLDGSYKEALYNTIN